MLARSSATAAPANPHPTELASIARRWLVAFSGQSGQLAAQSLGFILLARFLGSDLFGMRIALGAMAGIASPAAGFGFPNLLVRNTAYDPHSFAESWGNGLLVTLVTALALIGIGLPIAAIVLPAVPTPLVAIVLLSELLFVRLASLVTTAFQARGQISRMAGTAMTFHVARLAAVVFCLVMAPAPATRLWWWGCTTAFASGAGLLLLLAYARPHLGPGHPSIPRIEREWRDGLQFVLSPYAQTINDDGDKLILGYWAAPAVVGAYGAAYRLLTAALVPLRSLFDVTYPLFFAHGSRGIDASRRFAANVGLMALPTAFVMAAGVLVGRRPLQYLLGPGYHDTSIVLGWLCVLPVLRTVQNLFADALSGAGLQRRRTRIQAAGAALNVALNLVLDPALGWWGAAISSLASDGCLAAMLAIGARHSTTTSAAAPVAGPKPTS